jgi:hypothetical protein
MTAANEQEFSVESPMDISESAPALNFGESYRRHNLIGQLT